jgi:histidine triad (HIT) family protein
MSCLFCDIASGKVPSRKVHEDPDVLAFHDIEPQAPTHVLVVPKKHIASLLDLSPEDDLVVGRLVRTATDLSRKLGLSDGGFRLVFNCGEDAGYSVHHLHLHLVGGRKLGWPPG